MKKIYGIILFLIFSLSSFANFNDNLNIFKEEDVKLIEQKINEIAKEKKINIFVNTLTVGEGFAISDPEFALILNLKKVENDKKYEVELSLSKDIDITEYEDGIEEVLNGTEDLLKQEDYTQYIIKTLDGLNGVLDNIEIEPLEQMSMTQSQEENGSNIFIVGIIIFISLITGLAFLRLKKLDRRNEREEK